MAHRITYKPTDTILSSSIGDIEIAVDGDSVDVTLTNSFGVNLLSERYYAYSGVVTLHDIASLIESNMKQTGDAYARFTLKVFSDTPSNKADTWTLSVLHCDRYIPHVDVEIYLSENFLTTLNTRRIAPGGSIQLSLFAKQGESVAYTVAYRAVDATGELYLNKLTLDRGNTASADGIVELDISQETCLFNAASLAVAPINSMTLLSFTVQCGQRSITYFVDPALAMAPAFYFRNCFNVWDNLSVPVITTSKTEVERSIAIVNGSSRSYDKTTNKTYQVEAGPLTSDEAEWIDQLLMSHEVVRIELDPTTPADPESLAPIIITDSTCEVSDGDDKLNSVKFTWRYADNRPILRLSASPGIYSNPYNIIFS